MNEQVAFDIDLPIKHGGEFLHNSSANQIKTVLDMRMLRWLSALSRKISFWNKCLREN